MRLLRRLLWWTLAALALLAVAIWVAQRLSPWPGVWLLRGLFERGGVQTATALQPLGRGPAWRWRPVGTH
jgi:hypothetical protein